MVRLIGFLPRALACAAALVLAASPAFGDPPPDPPPPTERLVMRLDYSGVPGCSDPEPFTLALIPHVRGWDPLAPEARWRLAVTVKRKAPGYEGSADILDPSGKVTWTRSMPAKARCHDLLDALALVVAFYIDPIEGFPSPPPLPPAPAPPAPTLATPPLARAEPPRSPPAGASPELLQAPARLRIAPLFDAGAHVDFGLAPRPLVGLKIGAGVRRGWLSLTGSVRWDPRATTIVESNSGSFLTTNTFLTGSLLGCVHHEWSVSLAGCLVGELGQIQRGFGNERYDGFQQRALYTGAGASARAEVLLPATRLYLQVTADLLAARRLPTYVNAGMTINTGAVAGAVGGVGAGLGVSF
jgi:hypothetical protein